MGDAIRGVTGGLPDQRLRVGTFLPPCAGHFAIRLTPQLRLSRSLDTGSCASASARMKPQSPPLSQGLTTFVAMTLRDRVVYGERGGDQMPAMLSLRDGVRIKRDGRYEFSATLESHVGNPLRRALMRVEADLLLEDAAAIGTSRDRDRTHEQRAADALVRLVKSMAGKART